MYVYLFILLVNRIAIVKPERAKLVQSCLLQMAQRGAIQRPLDDAQLISLLSQVSGGSPNEADSDLPPSPSLTFVKRKPGADDDEDLDLSQFDV